MKASRRHKAQTYFAPCYRPAQMCLSLLCGAPICHIHHRSAPWETERMVQRAKPTICRRLEINDRPEPSGSPSHSSASFGVVTGTPNFPFSLNSMCETPASHAGVFFGETLGVDLVSEAQPFTQGSGQVEQCGETSCLPADYSGNMENWRGHRPKVDPTGRQLRLHFI